jgi:hypothetical protein
LLLSLRLLRRARPSPPGRESVGTPGGHLALLRDAARRIAGHEPPSREAIGSSPADRFRASSAEDRAHARKTGPSERSASR